MPLEVPQIGTRQLGWPLASLAVAIGLGSLVLLASNHDVVVPASGEPFLISVTGQVAGPFASVVIVAVLGALAIQREPGNWIGWCWSGVALLFALTLFAQEYAVHGLVVAPGTLPAAVVAAWLQSWLVNVLIGGVVLSLLIFPDGRLPSPRWRALLVLTVGVTVLAIIDSFADRTPITTFVRQEPFSLPVTMPPALWGLGGSFAAPSGVVVFWAQALLVPAAGVALVLRLRASRGEQRQQLKWVAYGGALAGAGFLIGYIVDLPLRSYATDPTIRSISAWANLVWLFGITIVTPIAAGIAILRYRLYDIDRVINRTLLVGGLAGFITIVYVGLVVGIGSEIDKNFGPALSLIATAVVAVAFTPVRVRLQAMANRLVYGKRATPYEVLVGFAERAGTGYLSDEVLPAMARLLGEGTGSRRAQVWLRVGAELRPAGSWPEDNGRVGLPVLGEQLPPIPGSQRAVPVLDGGELLGALTITKSNSERLTPGEEKLMVDLARQAGLVLRNVRLVEELRSSRQRIVSAQDEERRRLERNLHDGAQQQLVTASLALELARSRLRSGRQDGLERQLGEVASQLKTGLAELRTLARGLHPAVVTEAGLVAALESLADRSPIPVTVDSALQRRFSPPVEATAYYVVSEGLTNVVKHAQASAAVVRAAETGGRLVLEVEDDGAGGADRTLGSGLRGLEDRVAALGGSLEVGPRPGGGTRLRAELPNSE
jgi:signal transduction histidine kinase